MRYYYLIATLPEISPGNIPKDLDIGEVTELIRDNLEQEDRSQLNYLLYMNDNVNLINLLCEKKKSRKKVSLTSAKEVLLPSSAVFMAFAT